jgi:hypothetical protein
MLAPRQVPLELSHADMNAAYQAGLSIPFGQTVAWIMRYQDAWWVLYEGGWLRITDSLAIDDLDRLAVQMARADTSVARDTAIRAAIHGPVQPPSPGQSAEQKRGSA